VAAVQLLHCAYRLGKSENGKISRSCLSSCIASFTVVCLPVCLLFTAASAAFPSRKIKVKINFRCRQQTHKHTRNTHQNKKKTSKTKTGTLLDH